MKWLIPSLCLLSACASGANDLPPLGGDGDPVGGADAGVENDGTSGDGASDDGSNGDGSNGDGSNGDGSNGDGAGGDGANGDGSNGDGANGDGSAGAAEDYREKGTRTVTARTESATEAGCTFEVGVFEPDQKRTDVALVVAPGFAIAAGLGSSRDALDTLGEHVASWGMTTYTVALCTNGGSIDHPKNGAAIASFGEGLAVPVVYAGFSAGGLGAMIAAAQATNTKAYLALDAVDTNDLAKPALDGIAERAYALAGEPSSCNSMENMLAQYQGRAMRVLKINGAQHFIFEGAACQGIKCALCSGGGEPEAQVVRALATAFAIGASGARPSALDWWEDGSSELADLISSGLVSAVQ